MNKSTELCLHICKKLQHCKGESIIFKFYRLFLVIVTCYYFMVPGRLHFIDEKAKVNAKCYVESLLQILVADCKRLLPRDYKTTRSVLTPSNSHNSHHANDRRIYWNESGLDLLQNNTNNGQDHYDHVQLIPPASSSSQSASIMFIMYSTSLRVINWLIVIIWY